MMRTLSDQPFIFIAFVVVMLLLWIGASIRIRHDRFPNIFCRLIRFGGKRDSLNNCCACRWFEAEVTNLHRVDASQDRWGMARDGGLGDLRLNQHVYLVKDAREVIRGEMVLWFFDRKHCQRWKAELFTAETGIGHSGGFGFRYGYRF